jgi:hypothetical protein
LTRDRSLDENKKEDIEKIPPHIQDVEDSTAEELSKDEEHAMHWVGRLKKASKSRLITIVNMSQASLDRGEISSVLS